MKSRKQQRGAVLVLVVAGMVAMLAMVGLALDGGQYFGLNEVGTLVWKGLLEGVELDRIVEQVTAEFDVAADQAERDALFLVQRLIDVGLVRTGAGE